MSDLVRRLRSPLVAVVVLAISAGVVFAGGSMPQASNDGRATAAEASGKSVPVVPAAEEPTTETEEATDEAEQPAEEVPTEDAQPDNHGALVSEAARMDTPEAFEGNHGMFVSCVAHMKGDLPEGFDLAALTPEDCAAATDEATAEDGDDADEDAEVKPAKSTERGKSGERRGGRGHGRGGN